MRSKPKSAARRGDFGFLGLIGAKTKRRRFVHRFERRGVPAAAIARLTCPIGIEGIAGKQPEVLALAAVAQLLQAATRGSRDIVAEAAQGGRASA
jgi:xanthine/CO dehydrogenase XdhC/CoxF family maturation factor